MPRGKYVNHKGRSRHFTSPEELQQEHESSEEEKTSEEEEDGNASGTSKPKQKTSTVKKTTGSDDEDSDGESSGEDRDARKGVASLIDIENPNRAIKKTAVKVSNINLNTVPELSRQEREKIEKEKARQKYQKLHAAGKTHQAKSDLARLALIRQQRAEAAAKREEEKKALEEKKAGGTSKD